MNLPVFIILFGLIAGTTAIPIQAAAPLPAQDQAEIPSFYEMDVWVTAYSSTPEETDETPFITASGKWVEDGIIATNFLPFGTKVKIPEKFGDKVFVVEDRMHRRKTDFVDVWMPTKEDAKQFGIARTKIQILVD